MERDSVQGTTSIEVFNRCKPQISMMLLRLQKQLDFYIHMDDILSETQERWVACFGDIYEDDKQFLRYMFVVMKNRIRDLKKDKYRYSHTHISDPKVICGFASDGESGADAHVKIWNEMAADHKEELPPIRAELNELVSMIENSLSRDFHKKIFRKLLEGLPHKEISKELGCSTGHVLKTKVEFIWPVVKKVMKISEDKYEVLTDSGRIYCP